MDWIRLAQDSGGQWRALVNTVMTFEFHDMLGNPSGAEGLAVSKGLSSLGLVMSNAIKNLCV
jgi:hypothetical protein